MTITRFYVDAGGNYLGGFAGASPPAGAIEIPSPPAHAAQKWDGAKFLPLPPDPLALFAATIAAGCSVASATAPSLNGTYAIDERQQQVIAGIAAGIAARNRVPGGGATFDYPDIQGASHTFTGAQFLDFAAVVEDYVYALSRGESPAQPVALP